MSAGAVQQATLGHRGHKADPLYRTRRLMLRGWKRLNERQTAKLFAALAEGDSDWGGRCGHRRQELLREMYAARSLKEAQVEARGLYLHVADAEIAELTRLAKTVSSWELEFLNYHVTGISNGPTEARNLVTEKIRRVAHGMRNFRNYRLRLLLHSGVQWDTQSTARIRGAPTPRRVEPHLWLAWMQENRSSSQKTAPESELTYW